MKARTKIGIACGSARSDGYRVIKVRCAWKDLTTAGICEFDGIGHSVKSRQSRVRKIVVKGRKRCLQKCCGGYGETIAMVATISGETITEGRNATAKIRTEAKRILPGN